MLVSQTRQGIRGGGETPRSKSALSIPCLVEISKIIFILCYIHDQGQQ